MRINLGKFTSPRILFLNTFFNRVSIGKNNKNMSYDLIANSL